MSRELLQRALEALAYHRDAGDCGCEELIAEISAELEKPENPIRHQTLHELAKQAGFNVIDGIICAPDADGICENELIRLIELIQIERPEPVEFESVTFLDGIDDMDVYLNVPDGKYRLLAEKIDD